jgi:hypothetical protein
LCVARPVATLASFRAGVSVARLIGFVPRRRIVAAAPGFATTHFDSDGANCRWHTLELPFYHAPRGVNYK